MRKKQKQGTLLLVSLAVILLAGTAIVGIYAYMTAQDRLVNVTGVGYCESSIEEEFENPDIIPNRVTTITKKVKIRNTGVNTAGIRVRADFSSSDVLSYTTVDYNTGSGSDKWTKQGDFYYYNTPVKPNEETSELFTKLTLRNPTAAQVADFDVYVYSECRNCDDDAGISTIKQLFSN